MFKIMLLIFVAGLIFYFSTQTYDQQSLVPLLMKVLPGKPFSKVLENLEFSYGGEIISLQTMSYYRFIEFFIRKLAHLLIFGCFAVALFKVFVFWKPSSVWKSAFYAFLGVVIYATLDEVHQMITGDRTPLISDVVLDLIGGLLAVFVIALFHKRKATYKDAENKAK